MSEEKSSAAIPVEAVRLEEFISRYSNHIQFSGTPSDLKIIFGQLDQRDNKMISGQHTAMTLAWVHAKLLSYFLRATIAFYEETNGKIKLPADLLPAAPPPLPPELEKNPQARAGKEAAHKLWEEFISSQKS
jgi:hypothetical protein